jgi:hypothetical protein
VSPVLKVKPCSCPCLVFGKSFTRSAESISSSTNGHDVTNTDTFFILDGHDVTDTDTFFILDGHDVTDTVTVTFFIVPPTSTFLAATRRSDGEAI